MKNARNRGVLFDKDGTLIDFEATWFPIVVTILGELRSRYGVSERAVRVAASASGVRRTGFAKESLIQSATTSRIARIWSAIIAEHGYSVRAEEINRLFTDTAKSMTHTIALVPGAKRLLERLKRNGFRLGIATSDNRESTEVGLEAVGILRYFDFIAADGDGLAAKPAPDAAFAFSGRYGIDTKTLSVIGDSRGDMLFAQRAGARFIGMRTGCNAPEGFLAAGYPILRDFRDAENFERLIA
ncbi:MAG: HAD family hydrolase [Treponemataceae bacterium]